jgi:hypothetical protein
MMYRLISTAFHHNSVTVHWERFDPGGNHLFDGISEAPLMVYDDFIACPNLVLRCEDSATTCLASQH